MIERIKSLTFVQLGKHITIEDAEHLALMDVCGNILERDPDYEKPELTIDTSRNPRYYEINSKNIEYSTIKYLRSELNAMTVECSDPKFKTPMIAETLKSMDNLGLDDVRVRIIIFRVGARSYCVAEPWWLHKDAEPERVEE